MVSEKIPVGAYYLENMFIYINIYFLNSSYLPAVLVYGHKLDHGGFPVAAKIGDVNPNYTTNCHSNNGMQG